MSDLHLSQQLALKRLYALHKERGFVAYVSAGACGMSIVDAFGLHKRGLINMQRLYEGTSADGWFYQLTPVGQAIVESGL